MERIIQKQMPNTLATRSALGLTEDSKMVLIITLGVAFGMNVVL